MCTCVCMYVFLHVRMYARMHVYVHMYVFVSVCLVCETSESAGRVGAQQSIAITGPGDGFAAVLAVALVFSCSFQFQNGLGLMR